MALTGEEADWLRRCGHTTTEATRKLCGNRKKMPITACMPWALRVGQESKGWQSVHPILSQKVKEACERTSKTPKQQLLEHKPESTKAAVTWIVTTALVNAVIPRRTVQEDSALLGTTDWSFTVQPTLEGQTLSPGLRWPMGFFSLFSKCQP